jgi:transcriptional regulator with XRE-family HTH domain
MGRVTVMPDGVQATALREARGWTLAELSERAGISQPAARRIESSRAARPEELRAVEMALALPPGRLIAPPRSTTVTAVSHKWGAPEISRIYPRDRLLEQLDGSSFLSRSM